MGAIIHLHLPRKPSPSRRLQSQGATSNAIEHINRAVARYERDLGLLTGKIVPIRGDVDDLMILESFMTSGDQQQFLSDRRLRIKTLEATIELLREHLTDQG
jgi:hypothetical protein